MAMAHQLADVVLTDFLRGTATPHILLHTGSPGAAGTANVALRPGGVTAIVRKSLAFGVVGNHATNVERRVLSSTAVAYTGAEINAGQTITHFSIWSAATAGVPRFVAPVAVHKITGSDGVTVAIGDAEVAISVFVRP